MKPSDVKHLGAVLWEMAAPLATAWMQQQQPQPQLAVTPNTHNQSTHQPTSLTLTPFMHN